MDLSFFITSLLLGVGLAMDAFSVSIVNAMTEPDMKHSRMAGIAGVYAGFQIAMPILGWVAVHWLVSYFRQFEKFIPWIALILLLYIGGKMLFEGLAKRESAEVREKEEEAEEAEKDGKTGSQNLTIGVLMVQGVATSIDALSVGFTTASYNAAMAVISAVIIGVVTFFICMGGLRIGKKVGEKVVDKAGILGGVILIGIGLEIFIRGVIG